MDSPTSDDPFTILGVSPDAGEAEVRARYLELVKQYPPERDPEKFQEVRKAFEVAKDPLSIALKLIEPPEDEAPSWSSVLESQRRRPPRLTPAFVLSLGNRASGDAVTPPLSD
jgi:curved DNA-binding protein CbpA